MPEGDAALRAAIRLDEALAGERLTKAEIRVPRFATVQLAGAVVVETRTVGKHLLTRLVRDDRRLTLHSHMRMDGRWVFGKADQRPCAGPGFQIRIWLMSAHRQAVGLRMAEVKVVKTSDEDRLIGFLGPDVLSPSFSIEDAEQRVVSLGDSELVAVLLNQRVVCGLGTMWAAELAHHIGVNPYAPAATARNVARGLDYVRSEMMAAITAGPAQSRSRLLVFERNRQPCRTCGTGIRRGRIGKGPYQRVTYWCPSCQPPS